MGPFKEVDTPSHMPSLIPSTRGYREGNLLGPANYIYVHVCMCVCVCVCVFIKLHITTQSGPVILVILCHSH